MTQTTTTASDATYAAFLTSPKGRTMQQFAICSDADRLRMLAHSTTPERLRFVRIV